MKIELIDCLACGEKVSSLSITCPRCGHSLEKESDRSEVKFCPLITIIILVFKAGCTLAVLGGLIAFFVGLVLFYIVGSRGMEGTLTTLGYFIAFFTGLDIEVSLGMGVVFIIIGVCCVTVYGRLIQILYILTHPNKKAVQTSYKRLALIGSIILSIIWLALSFKTYKVGKLIVNLLGSLFMPFAFYILFASYMLFASYLIFILWNKRCIMDENFIEIDNPYQLLGRISVIVGISSLIFPLLDLALPLGPIAVIIGVIALRKKQKAGWWGIAMGAVGTAMLIRFLALLYCV